MPVKSATEKLQDTIAFLDNAKTAVAQIEEMRRLLETTKSFASCGKPTRQPPCVRWASTAESRQEMGAGALRRRRTLRLVRNANCNACHC
jgi:hypothetical protein